MTDRALFLSFDAAIGRKITDKAMITLEIAAPATPMFKWKDNVTEVEDSDRLRWTS